MSTGVDDILLDKLSADPGTPVEGQVWYNTTTQEIKYRNAGKSIVLASFYDFVLERNPVHIGITYAPTYTGRWVTQERWRRTSDSSLLKQSDYTYTQSKVTSEVRKVFAADGTTTVAQTTNTYTYTGSRLTGQTTVRDV